MHQFSWTSNNPQSNNFIFAVMITSWTNLHKVQMFKLVWTPDLVCDDDFVRVHLETHITIPKKGWAIGPMS